MSNIRRHEARTTVLCGLLLVLALAASGQTNYTVLRSFGFVDQAGEGPDVLIEGADGMLYGSAGLGSPLFFNASPDNPPRGLVFRLQKDGSGYKVLHRFDQTNEIVSDLVYATNGVLYGTTPAGGQFDRGTVFRLNTDGSGYAVLHDFAGAGGDGEAPRGLMQGSDGILYGTTTLGGASPSCGGGCGTAFKINLDGGGYAVVRSLSVASGEGRHPMAGFEEGSDGLLYGTARQGGAANGGAVFKMNKDGSGYATIVSFYGTNGVSPEAALLEGSDGALYGTTRLGGTANAGLFFKVNTDGNNFQVLHYFSGGADGSDPSLRLVEGTDGAIYGGTRSGGYPGTVFKANKNGSGYSVLRTNISMRRLVRTSEGTLYGAQAYEVFRIANDGSDYQRVRAFTIAGGDGAGPAWLIEGSDGFLYGACSAGGQDRSGGGAIFKLAKDGSGYTVLRCFTNIATEPFEIRGLMEASDGRLYAASQGGGEFRIGTIFRLNRDGGGFEVIVHFEGNNGSAPSEGLIEGSDGALYGSAQFGGAANYGVAFKVNKDGSGYTVLHHFTGYATRDGAHPSYGVLEATDGWLYGVSQRFGTADNGMIFKLRKDGSGYHELYNFADPASFNAGPCANLIEAAGGVIFGVTHGGGDHDAGTLFALNKDGTGHRRLLSFRPGYFPESKRVMEGSDGVLYGVTLTSGQADQGTLYRINCDGSRYSVVHHFLNRGGDGSGPWGKVIQGSDGALYGTTLWGGSLNVGTVFRYVPSPEVLSVQRLAGGGVRVVARALSGNVLAIDASADLSSWTEIGSGSVINGRLTVEDTAAGDLPHLFYRARLRM